MPERCDICEDIGKPECYPCGAGRVSRVQLVPGRRAVAVSIDGGGTALLGREEVGTLIDELITAWVEMA